MNICVYCASSKRISNIYFEATERLAREFVQAGVFVVYGGGASGLMGKLADSVLAEGGKIRGVIPHFMDKIEWTHPGLTEVIVTETMHERKMKFLDGTDAVVALPGGTGTFEELLEVITFKRLGLLTIPVVILNTNGYYAPLQEMFEKAISENFMRDKHRQMWTFVDEPEEVLPAIRDAAEWDKNAIQFAVP